MYNIITIIYSVTIAMIMPFISLYTRSITDVNYYIPIIGILFTINGIMYNLKKQIKSFGSLDAWLDSNKLYRLNFERNKKLVLSDYIPDSIFKSVIKNYNEQHPKYNNKEFREYILDNHFDNLLDNLPSNFSCKLTLDDLL